WVQLYAAEWVTPPTGRGPSWYNFSPTQFTIPVIGTVSRDGKYLVALANETSSTMTQAWQDCIHNNAEWQPATAATKDQIWREKIYAGPNDANWLLTQVKQDFPNVLKLNFSKARN